MATERIPRTTDEIVMQMIALAEKKYNCSQIMIPFFRLLHSVSAAELRRDLPKVFRQTLLHFVSDTRGNRSVVGFSNAPCDASQGIAVTPQ